MATMYARTDEQGTAIAEAALCGDCLDRATEFTAAEAAGHVDCTGNEALDCQVCGRAVNDVLDQYVLFVAAAGLEAGHVLVGESMGLSAVREDARPGSLMVGFVTVETEHGFLLLDDDREQTFEVIAPQVPALR